MHFVSINIKGLFGNFDYKFHFNGQVDDFYTILTGPNGYGKTTILTLLSKLTPNNLNYFNTLKFSSIELCFSDETKLLIEQKSESNIKPSEDADIQNSYDRIVSFDWFDSKGNLICKYPNKDSNSESIFLMLLETVSTYFIPANRIYKNDSETELLPIEIISNSFVNMLSKAYNDYLVNSQLEDSKFIKQVISSEKSDIVESDFIQKAKEVEGRRDSLMRFGLVNKTEIPAYNPDNSFVLFKFIETLEHKYEKYGDLPQKLELFVSLCKTKGFVNKQININPQKGLVVVSNSGEVLPLQCLSSGEQHEIVMLYRLIFNVNDDTVLLIDEPENGLHVVWQDDFDNDIKKIASLKHLQVIIATHSISIVSKGENNVIDLYYLING